MKNGKIVIDIQQRYMGVSLLEGGRLHEHYVQHGSGELLTGNIYKGRVVNVVGGLESVFVDIGREKNGFLNALSDDRNDLKCNGIVPPPSKPLKVGDYVMVQVTREETEQKGVKLSLNLTLPGQLLIYLPRLDFTGVSNKIEDEWERGRLMQCLESVKETDEGFIARTVSEGVDKDELLTEATELRELYRSVMRRFEAAGDQVCVVHSEGDLLFRTVRDMLRPGVDSIVCNDLLTTEGLRKEFGRKGSRFRDAVKLFENEYDILDVYGISSAVDKLLCRQVELPSGGSLVIEHTEALTAIDVNTARYLGAGDYAQSVYVTNSEAAAEIARQIRLRNIGGIIVVDFIDMQDERHKAEVVEILRREVARDRIKTRVLDMTGLGLVELTRKKVGNELLHYLTDACPHCKAQSGTETRTWTARKMKVALKRVFAEQKSPSAIVSCEPSVLEYIFAHHIFSADCKDAWREKRIYMVPDENLKPYMFTVSGSNAISLNLPDNAQLLY